MEQAAGLRPTSPCTDDEFNRMYECESGIELSVFHMNIRSLFENLWFEIVRGNRKYIVGGIYRHPNKKIDEFNYIYWITVFQ